MRVLFNFLPDIMISIYEFTQLYLQINESEQKILIFSLSLSTKQQVSSSCSSVYIDGSELRGSSNASIIVKYESYKGLAKFTVWMPEFPLEVSVSDFRLSQIKGWKIPEEHNR